MILKLEEHYSPDLDRNYYYIYFDNLAVYSTGSKEEADIRFDKIIEMGIEAYIKSITIQRSVVKEYDMTPPELESAESTTEAEEII